MLFTLSLTSITNLLISLSSNPPPRLPKVREMTALWLCHIYCPFAVHFLWWHLISQLSREEAGLRKEAQCGGHILQITGCCCWRCNVKSPAEWGVGEFRKQRSEATMTEGLRCKGGGWGDMETLWSVGAGMGSGDKWEETKKFRLHNVKAKFSGEICTGPWALANKICHHLSVRETALNRFLHIILPPHTGLWATLCDLGESVGIPNTGVQYWQKIT